MNRLDASQIITQIRALVAANPELLDDEVLAADTLEGQTDALDLVDQILASLAVNKAHVRGLKDHIEDMSNRLIRLQGRQDALRTLLQRILEESGLKRLERPAATLSLAKGPPKVMITDENLLAFEFLRIRQEPNKMKIKEALLAGNTVPGAQFSNSETTLTIRTA